MKLFSSIKIVADNNFDNNNIDNILITIPRAGWNKVLKYRHFPYHATCPLLWHVMAEGEAQTISCHKGRGGGLNHIMPQATTCGMIWQRPFIAVHNLVYVGDLSKTNHATVTACGMIGKGRYLNGFLALVKCPFVKKLL